MRHKNSLLILAIISLLSLSANADALRQDSVSLRTYQLREVVKYASPIYGVESQKMSVVKLTGQQINLVPAVFGETDALKVLQHLPGVNSPSEGTVGLFVRGGNDDQNLILLDGAPLYYPQHLRGYSSTLNSTILKDLDFYRGAFPSRYGGKLSAIIDAKTIDGNLQKYSGSITLGMLTGGFMVNGPIWKDHTSFVLSARASYMDLIVKPIYEMIKDNESLLDRFANMSYYDVNAKVTHKFSMNDKLSFSFYYGKDKDSDNPSSSVSSTLATGSDGQLRQSQRESDNEANTNWRNMFGILNYSHIFQNGDFLKLGAYISRFKYVKETQKSSQTAVYRDATYTPELLLETNSLLAQNSDIKETAINASFDKALSFNNKLQLGVSLSQKNLLPKTHVTQRSYSLEFNVEHQEEADSLISMSGKVQSAMAYVEDNWSIGRFGVMVGVRGGLYKVTDKTYWTIEPRVSARFLLDKNSSLKVSYSTMSQDIHRLSNTDITKTSDIWLSITDKLKPVRSDLYAISYTRDFMQKTLTISAEGYYKTLSDVIEYKDGSGWLVSPSRWSEMLVVGKGRSYGAEFFAEKTIGKYYGWLSYTWSKSLRTFDKDGDVLNGGREYYADNDRRNNVSLMVARRFNVGESGNSHLDISLAWTYITGRRTTIPKFRMSAGAMEDVDTYGEPFFSSQLYDPIYFDNFENHSSPSAYPVAIVSYDQRNNYKLPDVHHLDLSCSLTVKHNYGTSIINFSIYNLYNRKNINSVSLGFNQSGNVLKGVTMFPFMPSLSYTHCF